MNINVVFNSANSFTVFVSNCIDAILDISPNMPIFDAIAAAINEKIDEYSEDTNIRLLQ